MKIQTKTMCDPLTSKQAIKLLLITINYIQLNLCDNNNHITHMNQYNQTWYGNQ